MSEEIIRQILTHIHSEVGHYRQLLELVEKEREALLSRDHEALLGLSEDKMRLAEELMKMQVARREMMDSLPGRPEKLSDLTGLLPGPARQSFKTAVSQAKNIAKRLSDVSDSNRRYLEEALDTVEHMIGIFTGRNQNQAYGSRGRVPAGPARFLAREV